MRERRSVPRGVTRRLGRPAGGRRARVSYHRTAARSAVRSLSVRPRPRGGSGSQGSRDQRVVHAPGRGVGGREARRERDRHDRDGIGKSLAFNLPVLDAVARRPTVAGALSLSDEGADAGSGAEPRPVPPRGPAPRDLRRRHRCRAATADPAGGEPDPDEPRHAARRHPAASRPLGRSPPQPEYVVVDEAHVYRGVFGSHVGNVLRRLRRLARAYGAEPLPPRVGHDRESRRASARADRGARRPSSTATPRPRRGETSSCGIRRSSTRSSGIRASALSRGVAPAWPGSSHGVYARSASRRAARPRS